MEVQAMQFSEVMQIDTKQQAITVVNSEDKATSNSYEFITGDTESPYVVLSSTVD